MFVMGGSWFTGSQCRDEALFVYTCTCTYTRTRFPLLIMPECLHASNLVVDNDDS